jgi:hypothetical protein
VYRILLIPFVRFESGKTGWYGLNLRQTSTRSQQPNESQDQSQKKVWGYQPCNGPTLAEAILQSAIDAGSTASQHALSTGVDTALESNLRAPTVTGDPGDPETFISKWPTPPPVVSP